MNINEKIEVMQGDITKLAADAIVNAANSSLMGGGGVDGAIHRAGGKSILEECIKIVEKQGRCQTGNAVITSGGNLPSKFVIHTVGPVWHGGKSGEPEKLANCYTNSLKLAEENSCKTVAFPNISTGIYGFPKAAAAKIAVTAVSDFLSESDKIQKVIFVCFGQDNFDLINSELKNI